MERLDSSFFYRDPADAARAIIGATFGVHWLFNILVKAGGSTDRAGQRNGIRVMGIEPTPQAWEARVLPLNYTRLR